MKTWEYRVEEMALTDRWGAQRSAEETKRFEERLSALGQTGWEMISYETIPVYGGIQKTKLKGHQYLVFLKRERD
ncbi:MAG: hypothetical protein WEA29_09795 [Acidimicrobiia bacterium]